MAKNRKEQAAALTPGDWSSLKDVIVDLASDIDNLKRSASPDGAEKGGAPKRTSRTSDDAPPDPTIDMTEKAEG